MPEYLSPGVYVEEIDAGPQPIAGVSTSTAGMAGVTAKGPTDGKPQLVTSFADFMRTFGGFLDPPTDNPDVFNRWAFDPQTGGYWWTFPLCVQGFFQNGGQRVYIKRVFASGATAGTTTLGQGLVAYIVGDAPAGSTELKLDHVFGVEAGTVLAIYNGETQAHVGNVAVKAYQAAGRTPLVKLQDPGLPAQLLVARHDFAEIKQRAATATLQFDAISRGDWANTVSVLTTPVAENTVSLAADPDPAISGPKATTTVTATAQAAGAAGAWTITVEDVTGIFDNDRVQIKSGAYTVSNLNAGAKSFEIAPGIPPGETWSAGTAVRRVRKANAVASAKVNVARVDSLYDGALVELDNGTHKEVLTLLASDNKTGTVTLSGNLANVYFEGDLMRVIGIGVTVTYAPKGGQLQQESYGPLKLVDDGTYDYVVTNVNARSALVRLTVAKPYSFDDIAKFPTAAGGGASTLQGGDDAIPSLTEDDFVGIDGGSGARTGIQAFEDIDEISICAVPGVWSSTVHSALITHCESLADRFAILDPQDGLTIEGIQTARSLISSEYAALYYPWLVVRDPHSHQDVNLAPSGHIAGIYARTDIDRGVHKAPANVVIREIERIAQDVTKREQDVLNPVGINALRSFPNLGMRVWGARTLSALSSWKYVNVRRLFIFVEKSIRQGTQWVVFEPNDEPLWARVRQSISEFLLTVWRAGALEGTTPAEAFFVACDRTTMTEADIENGLLICVIGIAPVFPAEFVIFRIQQKTNVLQPA